MPLEFPLTDKEKETFFSHTVKSGDCLVWTGCVRNGYGRVRIRGENQTTSRIAWSIVHGPVPKGLHVLHNCPGIDNSLCCNPNHLWLGSNNDNIQDKVKKGRWRGNCKLSAIDVLKIIEMRKSGKYSQQQIASKFKVTSKAISMILTAKNWAKVGSEDGNPRPPIDSKRYSKVSLTKDDINRIKSLSTEGNTQQHIGALFGIPQYRVCRIINGGRKKHLQPLTNS